MGTLLVSILLNAIGIGFAFMVGKWVRKRASFDTALIVAIVVGNIMLLTKQTLMEILF